MNISAPQIGLVSLVVCLLGSACSRTAEPRASVATIRLCERYKPELLVPASAQHTDTPATRPPEEWRFDGPAPEPPQPSAEPAPTDGEKKPPEPDYSATRGFDPFLDVADLRVADGLLQGHATSDCAVLRVGRKPEPRDDALYSIELRMRVSAGASVALSFLDDEKFDRDEQLRGFKNAGRWPMSAPITAGDALQTCTILCDSAIFSPSIKLSRMHHMFVHPTDASDATFAIESIRFVTRREHLASIASGPGWHGLSDVFRQSLAMRAGESARFVVELPERAWLDLAIGAIVADPVKFEVRLVDEAGASHALLERTVTTPERWENVPVDLGPWARQNVRLELAVHSDSATAIGLFGSPIVRSHGAAPASETVASGAATRPQGVILMITDTLRRDHLDAWSYARPTAPTLARLAAEGARCKDAISQATWTKVSVPSILSSMFPLTHGIVGPEHRLPNGAVTVAEVFQAAGYATFATSSVAFSGKASNLQQGVDVLHERASVGELQHSSSKTARTFVDRTLAFIEEHRDVPFFIVLHVFDPHSPFEPYAPYSDLWSEPGAKKAHEAEVERIKKHMLEQKKEPEDMPRAKVLAEVGIDQDAFVHREIDWYDESIRGMDEEVARLMERLAGLGLKDKTLFALVADHGEEFLEHGRHFHGQSTYGELIEVPMLFWGPAWVRPGAVVEPTVQTIDLVPTLLDLAGLAIPTTAQGHSLAPLVARDGDASRFTPRPAFSQCLMSGFDKHPEPDEVESFSMISSGFQLVHNGVRPEGHPEFELYDHAGDPLDKVNLAADQAERVASMSRELDLWKKWALAARASIGADTGAQEPLTPAELREMQKLGYTK